MPIGCLELAASYLPLSLLLSRPLHLELSLLLSLPLSLPLHLELSLTLLLPLALLLFALPLSLPASSALRPPLNTTTSTSELVTLTFIQSSLPVFGDTPRLKLVPMRPRS